MDQGANTAARSTQVANAVAAGAVGVILGNTGAQRGADDRRHAHAGAARRSRSLGGGRAHLDWIKGLLAAGPLTLRLVTNSYVNHPRTNVIGIRQAVDDPTGHHRPDRLVGAHIDSVLGAPGAHDDATGNGATIEIARVLSQFPLDKEIRIGGFGGEEDGLVGARAYVDDADRRGAGALRRPLADGHGRHAVPAGRVLGADPERHDQPRRRLGLRRRRARRLHRDAELLPRPERPPGVLGRRHPVLAVHLAQLPQAGAAADVHHAARSAPDYTTEPEYHRPTDGMNNVSQERLQTTLDVVGGAAIHHALQQGHVHGHATAAASRSRAPRSPVTAATASATSPRAAPAASPSWSSRTRRATSRSPTGARSAASTTWPSRATARWSLQLTSATGEVGGTVPATLSLTIGPPASFGPFTPGVARDYFAATSANVVSTAGDAVLSVVDPSSTAPGRLVNGTFALPQPLQARARNAANTSTAYNNLSGAPLNLLSYPGPTSNDAVSLEFKQSIAANDALRTGTYAKALTFTLSTTTP